MEPTGDIVNTVSKTYPISFPKPGWSEQNPTDWYDKTCEGIKELIKDIDKDKVAGISLGGQMHGLVILDENDNVIRPAILWNDGRTTKECDYLNNEIGKDKLTEYTANIAFAGFTAPKLLWVKNNEPDNFKKIAKIMLPKDYIAYRLTGVHCTDVSDASGMLLLDVKKRDWSEEMINICKISRKQLPALYESYEKVGCITKEAAMELKLYGDVIESTISRTKVPVKTLLGESKINVSDFINLQVGDIIKIDKKVDQELDVYVGNIKKFKALPGYFEDKYAVRITDVIREESE